MTKAAVHNLTKNLAESGARWDPLQRARPGLLPCRAEPGRPDPERVAAIVGHTPLGRFGEADDLAGATLLLASDAGRFITGAEIVVDGGFDAPSEDLSRRDIPHDDFLLSTETARQLFHEVAEQLPDRRPPQPPARRRHRRRPRLRDADRPVARGRSLQVAGDAPGRLRRAADHRRRRPWEQFSAWAATVPRLIRNPLYVWTHLELRRVFGDRPAARTPTTARRSGRRRTASCPRLAGAGRCSRTSA